MIYAHTYGRRGGRQAPIGANMVPLVKPCNGINHPLGGGHPDASLFSTHAMNTFDGDPRLDFGGYLAHYAAIIDELLEPARAIRFTDLPRKKNYACKIDWSDDRIEPILRDTSLWAYQVIDKLVSMGFEKVSETSILDHRRALGVFTKKKPRGGGKVAKEPWKQNDEAMAAFIDPHVSAAEVARLCGDTIGREAVRRARKRTGIT